VKQARFRIRLGRAVRRCRRPAARRSPGEILKLTEHPDFEAAVPTPDHFIPLLFVAGLAAAQTAPLDSLVRGYAMGSLSMSCYGLETEVQLGAKYAEGAATLPEGVPAEQTNI
jgi:4,5-DOPA dioxygenase extradiol